MRVPGTLELMQAIVRQHGFQGLFVGVSAGRAGVVGGDSWAQGGGYTAGLVPRIIKVAPACAIMIGTYELIKQHFHARNREAGLNAAYDNS